MLRLFSKLYRQKLTYLSSINNYNKNFLIYTTICSYNLKLQSQRFFHISKATHQKLFIEHENVYVHNMLPEVFKFKYKDSDNPIRTWEDFERVLNQDWRSSTGTKIVETFKNCQEFSKEYCINLSDTRFDRLVDGLMDHCTELTDEELLILLQTISEFPSCDSVNSHNYHDIWCCLDDICCWKISTLTLNTMFKMIDCFYQLKLGRICDFTFEAIDRCLRKLKYVTKDDLVFLFFVYNICRRRPVDFDVEHYVAEFIDQFTIDELAIIALGYFKTQSKVKLEPILKQMIRKVEENASNISEISLTAILKVIRLSQRLPLTEDLEKMLNKLVPEIDRLSLMTCMHIALVGIGIQYKHDESLAKTTKKIVKDVKNVRLKDIERILLANAMFNFDPKTIPDFYEVCLEELHKDSRRKEMAMYSRCLPCALHYISYRNLYSYLLMNEVLAEDYIMDVYGKDAKSIPLALFSLDASIDIECADYTGNRLSPTQKYKAAKWLCDWAPTHDQKKRLTHADKLFLDTYDHLVKIVGDKNNIRVEHVLPHFNRADIILCQKKDNEQFEVPFGFDNYILGDIKRPMDLDNYKWYAVIILCPNTTLRQSDVPLGTIVMKQRQLKTIGYNPILIPWTTFFALPSETKLDFIKNHLNNA